jgi:hypothetical protein
MINCVTSKHLDQDGSKGTHSDALVTVAEADEDEASLSSKQNKDANAHLEVTQSSLTVPSPKLRKRSISLPQLVSPEQFEQRGDDSATADETIAEQERDVTLKKEAEDPYSIPQVILACWHALSLTFVGCLAAAPGQSSAAGGGQKERESICIAADDATEKEGSLGSEL